MPILRLTCEQFPRIGIARRTAKGEASYFGPFVSAAERDALIRVIKRIFLLRSCRKLPKRACLRYHMHTCSAPCIGSISEEDYRKQVDRATALLKGRSNELLISLREEMAGYVAQEDYEKALVLRNQMTAIGHLAERQHVERPKETDQDVIAYAVADETVYLMVFSVEKGLLAGKQEFSFDHREDFFEEFLVQYYAERSPPSELIVPLEVGEAMAGYLSERKGRSVHVSVPKIGEKKKLLELVEKNIEYSFLKNDLKVKDLQANLGLPDVPEVIECFDISHLAGTAMVGSMVQFRNGVADKKNYRRFRIKTVEGIDDFASIAEIVKRRYNRLLNEDAEMPDLIIIDGGKGQLSSARSSFRILISLSRLLLLQKRKKRSFCPERCFHDGWMKRGWPSGTSRRSGTKPTALLFLITVSCGKKTVVGDGRRFEKVRKEVRMIAPGSMKKSA